MSEDLLFAKIVDLSTLSAGISIPVAYQNKLYEKLGIKLKKGEQCDLKILIDGIVFEDAILKNQAYDARKFPNRADIVQIRYSSHGAIATILNKIFESSRIILEELKKSRIDTKTNIVVPEAYREYIIVYVKNRMVRFDCIANNKLSYDSMVSETGEDPTFPNEAKPSIPRSGGKPDSSRWMKRNVFPSPKGSVFRPSRKRQKTACLF